MQSIVNSKQKHGSSGRFVQQLAQCMWICWVHSIRSMRMQPVRTHRVVWSVCWSWPWACKNGGTEWDPIWSVDFCDQGTMNWMWTEISLQDDRIYKISYHSCFLQAGCPFCCPTNSVKARTHARTHTHTHTHTFYGPFPGLPGWAATRKVKPIWILLKQETMSGSGISWAICKSAPHSRQITTPAPHHSVFSQARCPSCRPTNSVKLALKASQSSTTNWHKIQE